MPPKAAGKKRKKREADAPMTEEEARILQCMPIGCGLPLAEKVGVGFESKRGGGSVSTVRARLCCAGCNVTWTPVTRVSEGIPTLEDAAKVLANKIEMEHLEHHVAAVQASYKQAGTFKFLSHTSRAS